MQEIDRFKIEIYLCNVLIRNDSVLKYCISEFMYRSIYSIYTRKMHDDLKVMATARIELFLVLFVINISFGLVDLQLGTWTP